MNNYVVFVRTGWMQWYGCTPGREDVSGGGAWNDTNIGHEFENFRNYNGKCFGYVRTGKSDGINLERVAPYAQVRKAQTLENVLVIVIAGSPQFIIGWYKNATIYRDYPDQPNGVRRGNFETAAKDCVLLPSKFRTHPIPKGQGAFGQANIYYLTDADGTPRTAEWIKQAIEFVNTYAGPNLVEDPRLEYGEFAHRYPTWAERVAIANASVDQEIANGETISGLVENIDVGDEYVAHVDRIVWPQYSQIQKLLKLHKLFDAVRLYEALRVDDDGDVVDWHVPYRITADGQPLATLSCNAIPMMPAAAVPCALESDESGVWKCAYSGRYFAINDSSDWLVFRELIEPRRMDVAKEFVKGKLEETDLDEKFTELGAKEHVKLYCEPKMTAHVKEAEFPEYKQIYSYLENEEGINAYTLYQKMMTDDEGELRDFDEVYFITGKGSTDPTAFCNAIPMIPRPDCGDGLQDGEDFVSECAVTAKLYAITTNPLSFRKLTPDESGEEE